MFEMFICICHGNILTNNAMLVIFIPVYRPTDFMLLLDFHVFYNCKSQMVL